MAGAPAEAQIALRRERMPVLAFERDERAALPRRAGAGLDYTRITVGAPAPIKSRLGRNIFISAFPYPQWIHGTGSRAWQEYRLVEVGTDRWQVTVCPDLGGRILGLTDRQFGRQLLWQPSAFQLAPIGLPGAWLLGGIEFNAFRFGHCVQGMMTVRTQRVQLGGGRVGLRWGAVDELLECEWNVVLAPLADVVAVQVTLQNHSDRPQPGYWWTNIAIPAKQGTRLFYHPGPVLHHGCDMGMLYEQWPLLNGNDWQYWQNHSGIISAYWPEYDSDAFGYAPPAEGWAMVHYADRRFCRGRKLWSVGSGHDAGVWMDRVGDPSAESYCEIQSGRLPTQLEADLLPPQARLSWVEYFTTIRCPRAADAAEAFAEFASTAAAKVAQCFQPDAAADVNRRTLLATKTAPTDVGGYTQPHQAAKSRTSRLEHADADFWRVTHAEALVDEDPRLALSRKVVFSPGGLTECEIRQATRGGWVGGAHWVRVLEAAPADEWRDLALGAAKLDLSDESGAYDLLKPLLQRGDECGGWASFLLGCRENEQGRREAANGYLQQALARLPGNLDARCRLHHAFLETNRVSEARDLWRTPPAEACSGLGPDGASANQGASLTATLAASDVARFARAQIAFLEQRWQDARDELERPMPCIAEGAAGPWLLRKEIELADALEQFAAGRHEEAQSRLLEGCRLMPQFGVGRYETTSNVDLLFYRWLLASRAGARLQAESLASHLLRFRPYAGSVEAAYVLRLALALGDPAAGPLNGALLAWDAEAEPVWRELLPLRYAVRQGTRQAWEPLLNHSLYRYRAQFEMSLDGKP